MNEEQIRDLVIIWPGVTEHFPFDEFTLVFKVAGKMFLLVSLEEDPLRANMKGTEEQNAEWREQYPDSIFPGYHMDKKHWNTVIMEGDLQGVFIKQMIKNSYDLVLSKLPKKVQAELKG